MPYMPYLCRICAVSVPYLPIIQLIWIIGITWSIEISPIILMAPDHPHAAHAVDAVWPVFRHRYTANTTSE